MRIVPKKVALLFFVIVFAVMWSGCTKKTSSNLQTTTENLDGKLVVTVYDKTTKKPITDAKIIVGGVANTYKTNEKGESPDITIKVNKDFYKRFGESLLRKAPSGSATILITKDGYKDYVLFNKAIYQGRAANTLKIEMTKLLKTDKQKYVDSIDYPHKEWVKELVDYCKNIKDEKAGSGQNMLNVVVKDQSSKAVDGAYVIIPELSLKVKTDKNGKGVLNPEDSKDVVSLYPVNKDISEYTVVVIKDGYTPIIMFNTQASKDKSLNITLKPDKDSTGNEFTISSQPNQQEWVEKVINALKQQVSE